MIARRAIAILLTGIAFGSTSTGAAPVDGGCKLVKIAEWTLRPGRPWPVADGAVNERDVGVLIDTGAMRTLLTRATAIAFGLARAPAAGIGVIGIGGTSDAETALVRKFKLGEAVRFDWQMLVAGDRPIGDIGIVLGSDFLHNVDVEFDLAHDTIRLFQAKDCRGASLAYWATEGAGQVPLEASDPARAEIVFAVRINGHPLRAKLDSGSFASLIMESSATSLGAATGVVAGGCIGGAGRNSIDTWLAEFETFEIGDEIIRNPRIRFADILKFRNYTFAIGEPDMLLGADFLRAHRVLIAHSQRKMYFTYAGGPVFPAQPGRPCDALRPAPGAEPATPASPQPQVSPAAGT